MANTTDPYIHNPGDNSWNDLVRRVNAILESPPDKTDCDPIAPLPEVDECHRWAAQDITDMQDALKETCDELVFTDVAECDAWQLSIVQELEDALGGTWCDCEPDEELCFTQCSNAQPNDEIFLQTWILDDGDCVDISRPPDWPRPCPETDVLMQAAWAEYRTLLGELGGIRSELCILIQEVIDLEEEVADLTVTRDAQCAGDPSSPACIQAQADLDAKQAILDAKIIERDAKQAEDDAKAAEVEAKAAETIVLAGESFFFAEELRLIDLLTGSHPVADIECDLDPPRAICDTLGIAKCITQWSIQRRTVKSENGTFFCTECRDRISPPFNWHTAIIGEWSPEGNPVARSTAGCASRPAFQVASTDCGSPLRCVLGCQVEYEYRQITDYPFEFNNTCCNTGDPCDPMNEDRCPDDPGGGPEG